MDGELDTRVRAALDRGDTTAAATLLVDELGSELLGYLWLAARSWGDGDELFSRLCERLWRGLPRFRFECPVRTWTYVIARNLVRTESVRTRKREDVVALAEVPELIERVAAVRTSTLANTTADALARLEALRTALDEHDRTLLILRVDRRMSWRDIAEVLADGDEDREKVAARLRKRFERVKDRLREQLVREA
ncbi:MAG TPA: sigma-70 family RNA polymerase sigma factor [Nannocystaceae bacterium]|nr:sigma-70 family RNA polymerase sigma factor [Nannocystaceae bacterium]